MIGRNFIHVDYQSKNLKSIYDKMVVLPHTLGLNLKYFQFLKNVWLLPICILLQDCTLTFLE